LAAWTRSHDLRRLEDRFLLPRFTSVIGSPDMAPFSEDLFGQMTDSDRRNTFMSFWNYAYLLTVMRRSTPQLAECWDLTAECEAKRRQFLLSLFPSATVDAVFANQDNYREPADKDELLAYVGSLGDVFEKALPTLKKLDLEQSPEFRSSMELAAQDLSLNYFIEPGTAAQDYRDSNGRVVIAKGEKLFGVETPLLLRIDLVQRGDTYKVFNIAPGGGD
jgi:hypothetical protein